LPLSNGKMGGQCKTHGGGGEGGGINSFETKQKKKQGGPAKKNNTKPGGPDPWEEGKKKLHTSTVRGGSKKKGKEKKKTAVAVTRPNLSTKLATWKKSCQHLDTESSLSGKKKIISLPKIQEELRQRGLPARRSKE